EPLPLAFPFAQPFVSSHPAQYSNGKPVLTGQVDNLDEIADAVLCSQRRLSFWRNRDMALGFLTLFETQIAQARASVRAGLAALAVPGLSPLAPDPTAVETMLFDGIADPLEQLITPALALELN